MTKNTPASKPRFCSECGTQFLPDALFCHNCGVSIEGHTGGAQSSQGLSPTLRWGLPAAAVLALVVLTFFRIGSRVPESASAGAVPLSSGAMAAPDISSMSPEERANRLFNRVMSLAAEGKRDSAAFFAPMAMSAIEALGPLSAHSRYDLGLVALVSGDVRKAAALSDAILEERPSHLLGLSLAARVADARGDVAAGRAARQKLLAAEKSERASGLPEYTDHDSDLRAAADSARSR